MVVEMLRLITVEEFLVYELLGQSPKFTPHPRCADYDEVVYQFVDGSIEINGNLCIQINIVRLKSIRNFIQHAIDNNREFRRKDIYETKRDRV